eukprot:Skav234235  [mRNA]  locus=scaffold1464:363327:364310:- [translate_table: standard]
MENKISNFVKLEALFWHGGNGMHCRSISHTVPCPPVIISGHFCQLLLRLGIPHANVSHGCSKRDCCTTSALHSQEVTEGAFSGKAERVVQPKGSKGDD